jgi:hypothetical protein
LASARRDYAIDDDRVFVRGFSMGGAACWQFGVHHAGLWAGVQPGAGFSETPEFLSSFQGETLNPRWWEEKLWRWYDATSWVANLANTTTIAYSGELDRQKQAADLMAAAARKEGMDLVHLVGPGTKHSLHPDTLTEIEHRLTAIAGPGRDSRPLRVRFVTYTLRYNRMHWVRIDGMTEHWEPARIDATWTWPDQVTVDTSRVSAFSLVFPPGGCPLDPARTPVVNIDGLEFTTPRVRSDRGWEVSFHRDARGVWATGEAETGRLHKHSGLQGPIDDAFMDSFLMVAPTGQARHDQVTRWCQSEMEHALTHWRKQFRGAARLCLDTEVTDKDIATHNLVLWGDPESNRILHRISSLLPIQWNPDGINAGPHGFAPDHHALVMIFPNPLNPRHYVVLNSGFTFREYDYLNNARQTPKLPDWAVIDLREPPGNQRPGRIALAGFFDENWEWKEPPASAETPGPPGPEAP